MWRTLLACLVMGASLGCDREAPLVSSYYHSTVAGKPFDPRAESGYGTMYTETRNYMALCLYEDDTYGYVTHYWGGRGGDRDAVAYGDLSRPTPDSVVLAGVLSGMRGQIDSQHITVANGTHVFTNVTWVWCPPKH